MNDIRYHQGDPCVFCGARHDDVNAGNCHGWTMDTLARLADEVIDWREGQRRVMAENCAPDEKHCTCVPVLRKAIEELEADRDRLMRACMMAREELQFGGDWQGARAVIDGALRFGKVREAKDD